MKNLISESVETIDFVSEKSVSQEILKRLDNISVLHAKLIETTNNLIKEHGHRKTIKDYKELLLTDEADTAFNLIVNTIKNGIESNVNFLDFYLKFLETYEYAHTQAILDIKTSKGIHNICVEISSAIRTTFIYGDILKEIDDFVKQLEKLISYSGTELDLDIKREIISNTLNKCDTHLSNLIDMREGLPPLGLIDSSKQDSYAKSLLEEAIKLYKVVKLDGLKIEDWSQIRDISIISKDIKNNIEELRFEHNDSETVEVLSKIVGLAVYILRKETISDILKDVLEK